ncbi:unnamed protein product, partial [marine sediment metagenome]
ALKEFKISSLFNENNSNFDITKSKTNRYFIEVEFNV